MKNLSDIPIIGQPRVEDYTIIFQVRCPCGTSFQIPGLIGASAKCPAAECPNAFLVNGPASVVPNMTDGSVQTDLPLAMMRLGPDGRPL